MTARQRVLVVEDSESDRKIIHRYLAAASHLVIEDVETAEAGLAACLRGGVDVILLDLHLPAMDGLELLRQLTSAGLKIPVVVMTSSSQDRLAQAALELGALDFLVKEEMGPGGLPRAISNAFIRARLQHELAESFARSESLALLTATLTSAMTAAEVMATGFEQVLSAAGGAAGFVALVDGGQTRLTVTDYKSRAAEKILPGNLALDLDAQLPYLEAVRTNQLVTCGTLAERDARYPALRGSSRTFRALACLPLGAGEEQQGVICIFFAEAREFPAVEKIFLTLLARCCGEALRRARAHERERLSREQLKVAADFERYLIGIVSHDLKSPLHTVLLQTQVMARQPALGEPVLKSIGRIERAARNGQQLIGDLLDFAQTRNGRGFAVTPTDLDVGEVVIQSVEAQRANWPSRQIAVETSGDLKGCWDRNRIEQVVTNLLSNAMQHGDPAFPVTIEVRREDHIVALEVANRGPPIPPQALAHLFEPFRSGGGRRSDHNVGLGLFIVDLIVKAHAGTVAVTSTVEDGTRFVIRLPRENRYPQASPPS